MRGLRWTLKYLAPSLHRRQYVNVRLKILIILKGFYSVTLELTFHRHQVDMVSIYDFLVYQVLNIQPYDNELNLP